MFNIKCRNTIYFSMRKTSLSQAVFVVKVAGTNAIKKNHTSILMQIL